MFLNKLPIEFFNRKPSAVAKGLLGKVMCVKYANLGLYVQIIETEAYYIDDKASHASLGFTEKRKALFMSPGTIYMYYSRAGDSMNISCAGKGNAVLIKAGYPYQVPGYDQMIKTMQKLNPKKDQRPRPVAALCSGQALLCKSLNLKVKDWDQKTFNDNFYIADVGYQPEKIIQTTRLGIRSGRDEHLPYRFIDFSLAAYCTDNPLKKRFAIEGETYQILRGRNETK